MKRNVLLIGSGLLVAFYLYVLQLAANPHVSVEYKLYYIDQKLKYWPEKNGLSYQLGMPIHFNKKKEVVNLSRKGWSEPEQQGTWTIGHQATLYLLLNSDTVSDRIILKLNARPILHKNHPELRISITINDIKIGKTEYKMDDINNINGMHATYYIFPSHLIKKDMLFRVGILIENPVSPKFIKNSNNSRLLGIMVRDITLSNI
jgi:hypothetical protein